MKLNKLTTNRFVIRKSLIGKNTIITFTTKKGKTVTYNHDVVYNTNKERITIIIHNKKFIRVYIIKTHKNNIKDK